MQRAVRLIMAAVAGATLACGSEETLSGPPTAESLLGVYSLTSVNGSLPYRIAADGDRRLDIVSGSFEFRADQTFTELLTTRLSFVSGADPISQTGSQSGSYTLFGSNVEVRYSIADSAVVDTVAITGKLMHRNDGGLLLTYRK